MGLKTKTRKEHIHRHDDSKYALKIRGRSSNSSNETGRERSLPRRFKIAHLLLFFFLLRKKDCAMSDGRQKTHVRFEWGKNLFTTVGKEDL